MVQTMGNDKNFIFQKDDSSFENCVDELPFLDHFGLKTVHAHALSLDEVILAELADRLQHDTTNLDSQDSSINMSVANAPSTCTVGHFSLPNGRENLVSPITNGNHRISSLSHYGGVVADENDTLLSASNAYDTDENDTLLSVIDESGTETLSETRVSSGTQSYYDGHHSIKGNTPTKNLIPVTNDIYWPLDWYIHTLITFDDIALIGSIVPDTAPCHFPLPYDYVARKESKSMAEAEKLQDLLPHSSKTFDPGLVTPNTIPLPRDRQFRNILLARDKQRASEERESRKWDSKKAMTLSIFTALMVSSIMPDDRFADIAADSGADSHMVPDTEEYRELVIPGTLTHMESTVDVITGSGCLPCNIRANMVLRATDGMIGEGLVHLNNVLLVKGLTRPLLSVPQLDDDGYIVQFGGGRCTLTRGGTIAISFAKKTGTLYLLPINCFLSGNASVEAHLAASFQGNDQFAIVHDRYGHRRDKHIENAALAIVGRKPSSSDKYFCEGCARTKLTKRPFPKTSRHVATRPGEDVFIDTCGPFRVRDPWGNRYFLLFVDSFYDYSHLKPQIRKSELDNDIQDYVSMLERQIQPHKITNLHSDNATCSNLIKSWLKQTGIRLILTAPGSSETNGKVERNLRTIQESGQAMRCKVGVPLS